MYALCQVGTAQKQIAKLVHCSASTISRELRRNKDLKSYRPKQAHNKAIARKANNARKIVEDDWQYVISKLHKKWSPQQISQFVNISHETIYQFIDQDKRNNGLLWLNLRHRKKYRKRTGGRDKRGSIINPLRIDKRPSIVDKRNRLGDVEVDTIIARKHKQAIVGIVNRASGYTWIKKLARKTASNVSQSIIQLLKPIRYTIYTITSDNGKEELTRIPID